MDCRVKGVLGLGGRTKVQQVQYVDGLEGVVALGTEDGRVCFFDTSEVEGEYDEVNGEQVKEKRISRCKMIAQLGGKEEGIVGRIKDFAILPLKHDEEAESPSSRRLVITGSSDGAIRLWLLDLDDLTSSAPAPNGIQTSAPALEESNDNANQPKIRQVGTLVGSYETGNRITCLKAFVMSGQPDNEAGDEPANAGAEEEENSTGENSESE
jgi:protein MAK11